MEGKNTEILMHSIRMVSPRREMVLVDSEFLRKRLDVCWVFVEEDLFNSIQSC